MKIGAWIKEHPYETAAIAVGGLGLLYFMGLFGGGSSGGSNNAAAYYAAQAAQTQSGNQLQETQIAAQASTTQALAADYANTTNATTWANAAVTENQSNNQAATAMAPYGLESSLISGLTQVASLPPTVTTKSSSGFLGIGGGSSQVSTPNPASMSAAAYLNELAANYPAH